MKAAEARALVEASNALVELVSRELSEVRDACVEVDERQSQAYRDLIEALNGVRTWIGRTEMRVADLEAIAADNTEHSRAVPPTHHVCCVAALGGGWIACCEGCDWTSSTYHSRESAVAIGRSHQEAMKAGA